MTSVSSLQRVLPKLRSTYDVPRVSRVTSSCLGYLLLACQVLTVVYFVKVLLLQHSYLRIESPDGEAEQPCLQCMPLMLSLFFDASCCLIPRLCPGTARVTLRKPIKYPGGDTTASYHYCDSSSNHGVVPPANVEKELLPCQYRDEHFVLYPPVEKNAMFATTFFTKTARHSQGQSSQ